MEKAAATHMHANMVVPILASMLTCSLEENTSFMMTNKAVAIMAAAVTQMALRNARIPRPNAHQRLRTERGRTKMRTKDRQAPVRNSPNMTCETILMMLRTLSRPSGSVTRDYQQSV